jgi:hypothetical protein
MTQPVSRNSDKACRVVDRFVICAAVATASNDSWQRPPFLRSPYVSF